jgi:hypothetical protein
MTFPDTEHWKQHLDYKVESAAAHKDGRYALSLDDKNLRIFSPLGKSTSRYKCNPPEPLLVSTAGEGWATLARDSRILRGHESDGSVLWSLPLPWGPWSLRAIGPLLLVTGIDGPSLLVTLDGEVVAENREPRQQAQYFLAADGAVCRAYLVEQTLIVADFGGRLLWRYTSDVRIGPFTVAAPGVWAFLGRTLTFFPIPQRTDQ